jgi:hypothetical protein
MSQLEMVKVQVQVNLDGALEGEEEELMQVMEEMESQVEDQLTA